MSSYQTLKRIGRGRSAEVYLASRQDGETLVRKVFRGDSASHFVLFILTGSANPYTWSEPAVRSALIRREILQVLVKYWFDEKLRLPEVFGWGWNSEYLAYEINTEFIEGHHLPLCSPIEQSSENLLEDLVASIMKPLQELLPKAGFDGLVWQAGKGNPVASSNFMLEQNSKGELCWVWIDLESGVPALFALNPITTITFYIPKSFKHRNWLFDDVDIVKLLNYLNQHRNELRQKFGGAVFDGLVERSRELSLHQDAWKSLKRYRRGVEYEFSQDRISEHQRQLYIEHPIHWYLWNLKIIPVRLFMKCTKLIKEKWMTLQLLKLLLFLKRALHYLCSSSFRRRIARYGVIRRIRSWRSRCFIDKPTTLFLYRELQQDVSCEYLTDFSLHLAIKPAVKFIQWWFLPTMWALGFIDNVLFGILLVSGGALGRTLYTLWRFIQSLCKKQDLPWIALVVGVFPIIGNAAYPFQLLYRSTYTTGGGSIARFIIYDLAAAVGRKIPIWGGADTLIEHRFSRVGVFIAQKMMKLKSVPAEILSGETTPLSRKHES